MLFKLLQLLGFQESCVASLTVRQLDDKLKKQLRLRAAKNGRSVEDEVRTILRSAAADADAFAPAVDAPSKPGRRTEPDAPHILLIIGGGIAAYKSLDLIRRLRERGIEMRVVMTAAAQKFITPLSVGAIAGEHPFTELFDARSEFDVGHIRLARDPSLIVVAPATADLMAKMANGLADDLASAVLLATDKTVLLAPAMNPLMWSNRATRGNLAAVTLVSGPVNVPDPRGVNIVQVESARDMLAAVERALPADVAVFAAAVADWRTATNSREKIKKSGKLAPELSLVENPDILSTVAHLRTNRPRLVIGFAAETEHVVEHAKQKLARKACDWILANDVSPETGIMGGDSNTIHLVTKDNVEHWPPQSKDEVASALIQRIAAALAERK